MLAGCFLPVISPQYFFMQPSFLLFTSLSLLDSINPCAISILLLTVGFLLSLDIKRKQILTIGAVYILGIFLTYILIGLGVLSALSFFGIPKAISKFGALILMTYSLLSLAEIYIPNFPIKLAIPSFIKPQIASLMYKASLASVFLMGVVVGIFEFPCTGGPYLTVLTLLHDQSTVVSGFFWLIYYNLVFVSPLVLILLLTANKSLHQHLTSFRHSHSKKAGLVTSLLLFGLGVIIFLL